MKKEFNLSKEAEKVLRKMTELDVEINIKKYERKGLGKEFTDLTLMNLAWGAFFNEETAKLEIGEVYFSDLLTVEEAEEIRGTGKIEMQRATGYRVKQNEKGL